MFDSSESTSIYQFKTYLQIQFQLTILMATSKS